MRSVRLASRTNVNLPFQNLSNKIKHLLTKTQIKAALPFQAVLPYALLWCVPRERFPCVLTVLWFVPSDC